MDKKINALVLNKEDNVAVAFTDLEPGNEGVFVMNNETHSVKITQDIPIYHKFAIYDINSGQVVKKYGEIIGKATSDIKKGDYVHRHNIVSLSLYVE